MSYIQRPLNIGSKQGGFFPSNYMSDEHRQSDLVCFFITLLPNANTMLDIQSPMNIGSMQWSDHDSEVKFGSTPSASVYSCMQVASHVACSP